MLSKITVVGMKYHTKTDAFGTIIAASAKEPEEQLLFLVADPSNTVDKNAVMLHSGVNKLGYVAAGEAEGIRKFIDQESLKAGQEQVIVVAVAPLSENARWGSSIAVKGIGLVYERIARKYAQSLKGSTPKSVFN